MKKRILTLFAILTSFSVYSLNIENKNGKEFGNSKTHIAYPAINPGKEIKDSIVDAIKIEGYREQKELRRDRLNLGLGLGLDYGGIGGNLLVYPQRNIGLFCGVGYALAGVGFNPGIKLRFVSKNSGRRAIPYLIGMIGYNTAIQVKNASYFNALIYGKTFGVGVDIRRTPHSRSYWSFGLNVPIRTSEVDYYISYLKDYGIEFKDKLKPVLFSVGYRFILF